MLAIRSYGKKEENWYPYDREEQCDLRRPETVRTQMKESEIHQLVQQAIIHADTACRQNNGKPVISQRHENECWSECDQKRQA